MAKKDSPGICYYCGAPATTREHAPPKMLFRGFECDSITVPSCEEHNNSKSGNDQAIIAAFLIPLWNWIKSNRTQGRGIDPDILRAVEIGESSFDRVKKVASSTDVLRDVPTRLRDLPEVSYIAGAAEIRNWVRMLTAAVISDGWIGNCIVCDWEKSFIWSPNYISSSSERKFTIHEVHNILKGKLKEVNRLMTKFTWHDGWSAFPRPYPESVYRFQILIRDHDIAIAHEFYQSYRWLAFLPINKDLNHWILEKLESKNTNNIIH